MKWLILLPVLLLAASSCKKSGFLKKSYIRFKVNGHEQVSYRGDEAGYQNLEIDYSNRYTLFTGKKGDDNYIYIASHRSYDITTGAFVQGNTSFALDSVKVSFGDFNHDEYIEGSFHGFGFDSLTGNRIMISEGEFYIHN